MSTRDLDVIVVGDLNPDLILTGDVAPAFGQREKLIDDARLELGGSAAICACGLARLGLHVLFLGLVGDDLFGVFSRQALASHGVDASAVRVDTRTPTGLGVLLNRGVDRAILTLSGSIGALTLADLDLTLLPRARHLHLGSYFLLTALQPAVPTLFDRARAHGLTTSLDTNYDPTETWDSGLAAVLARTDIFLPNETEATAITRAPDPTRALAALAPRVPTVALKLGAHGALAQSGPLTAHAPALPQPVVDTTGAGDSFDAGFIYAHLHRWPLPRALALAVACGSLSTRAHGGTAAQPTLPEALAAL